jgi:predicted ribosome quality control (RQC) complex YloA/Tae2 family protein
LKIAQERLERLKFEIKQLENLLDELASCENFDALKKFKEKNLEELKKFGIVKDKIVEKIGGKFRRFVVDGGFEVWVGKDAKSNELLTFKFSDKEDLWFHARGTSGAHVVLKTGEGNQVKKPLNKLEASLHISAKPGHLALFRSSSRKENMSESQEELLREL